MLNLNQILTEFSQIPTLPKRRQYGQELTKQLNLNELKELINLLQQNNTKQAWELISHLIIEKLFLQEKQFVIQLIEALANYEDWEIREQAPTVIKRLKKKYFEKLYPTLKEWVDSKNSYLQRAVSVGLIGAFKDEDKNLDKEFYLWEKIIQSDDNYVKKNCGPFGLAYAFSRFPKEYEQKFYEWLKKYKNNINVIWNIISVFSQNAGKKFPEHGKRILGYVKQQGFLEKFKQLQKTYDSVANKVGLAE